MSSPARQHENASRKAGAEAPPQMSQRAEVPSHEREDAALSNQALLEVFGIRAKRAVSQPGDPAEEEADRFAEAFMAGQNRPPGNQEMLGALGVRANAPVSPGDAQEQILRKCATCATEEEPLMRQAIGTSAPAAAATSARGGGQPLGRAVRAPFERFYRADLSHVRLHTDVDASRSAMSLSARAYTQGADLVFGEGEYAPHTTRGMKLLAHELAHVVHHGRGAGQGSIWRQVLTPEEMLGIITRERAFTYSPGAGQVCEDPRGVGRGVGAAAGGRPAGSSVFAVIQVTDANGRPVALSYGAHLNYGDPHAEQRAIAGLNRTIPQVRDISGGRMTVVVDQIPCPPGRANCMGTLRDFARQRGLQLEIHVPTRERMGGGGTVAPRTAAMSTMRTDTPPVTLTRYQPAGTTPPAGGGGGMAPPVAAAPGGAPIRFVAPRVAPPAMARAQASAIAALGRQTQRSIRISGRIRLGVGGVGGLLGILGAIHTVRTAQQMAAQGTVLADAEAQADAVIRFGSEMQTWAEETTAEVSLMEIVAAISNADERGDSTALFDIDSALTDTYQRFSERADEFRDMGQSLRAREQGLGVMSDFFERLISLPQGPSTAPNAEALAMHISLDRLQGRVATAASHFEAAARQLRFYADQLEGYASSANDRAWAIVFSQVAVAVAEAERERELDERIRRERRLNEIHVELEAINAELDQPVCRPPEDLEPLRERREALLAERAVLQSS